MHILEIEITSRCNLDCLHCYNREKETIDLPFKTIKDLIDFARMHKVNTLVISGGEPLLHPEISRISTLIGQNKEIPKRVIQSNGLIVMDDLDVLRLYDWVHLSYDIVKDVRISGSENLKKAVLLKKDGIRCYLFSTIHRSNAHLIDKMLENAHNNDVPIGFNIIISSDSQLSFDIKERYEIEKKLSELSKQGLILPYNSPLSCIFKPHDSLKLDRRNRGGCTAGISLCVISYTGDIHPCPFFRLKIGNIFDNSLEKIWMKSDKLKLLRYRRNYDNPCGECKYIGYCGGCRNRVYQKTGKLNGADSICLKELHHSTTNQDGDTNE